MATFVKGEICLFVLHALATIYLFPFYILTFLVFGGYLYIYNFLAACPELVFLFHFSFFWSGAGYSFICSFPGGLHSCHLFDDLFLAVPAVAYAFIYFPLAALAVAYVLI